MALKIVPEFKNDDYIINPTAGDMAVVKKMTDKGYYQFKYYYSKMGDYLKDLKKYNYELQVNYQKFFRLCTDEEKKIMDDIIANNPRRSFF